MKNLAKKMLNIMNECSHVLKKGENNFHHYKYATSADVLEKVNASLVKNGICSVVVPEVLSMVDVTNAKGSIEHLATVKMDIMLIDKDSGECASITGLGSGQDGGDKAIMKAQTAAIKYAYMLSLAISTGDDPEEDKRTDENMQVIIEKPIIKNNRVRSMSKTQINSKRKEQSALLCSDCGTFITEKVRQYSKGKFGRTLCMYCQKKAQATA